MNDLPAFAVRHPRIAGAAILLALHGAFIGLRGLYLSKPEAAILLIGALQLFYAVPAAILMLELRQVEMAKGLALGAAATFILNAGGCGVMLWQLSKTACARASTPRVASIQAPACA